MKKMSLRMRLTLFTILLLTCVAIVFTLSSMYNANLSFVVPYISYSTAIKDQDLPVPPNGQSQEASPEATISSSTSIEAAFPGGAYQPPDESTMDFDQSVSMITASASRFNNTSLFIMLGVIAGGGLLTYFLLGRALAPVRELSKEIQGITENELSERVAESDRNDEIGQLARSFNTMLERLDKAFSDQKRFSSDAAHELKTPLAAIKTNIDVLQLDDDPTSSEYKETIEVVKKQTGRMIRLVDDLFTMSAQRDYDFNDTIFFDDMFHDIIGQLKPRIAEKNLSVDITGCNHTTKGNCVMLTRAFSNLIENAIKYNVDGGSIDVSMAQDGRHYIIKVADSGIGIPEEKQKHIFKPFYRADHSRSRKAGGAGLGLAIAKDIIDRHGGTVDVSSVEKGGSIFTVTLPILCEKQK